MLTGCAVVVGGATSDDGCGSSVVDCSATPCISSMSPASSEGTTATVGEEKKSIQFSTYNSLQCVTDLDLNCLLNER